MKSAASARCRNRNRAAGGKGLNMPEINSLIIFVAVLFVIFIVFKIFHLSLKLFFKLLLNALIGAALLIIFNYVFAGIFNWEFFAISINWVTALVTGILGIPGVIILLVIKLLMFF